MEIKTTEFYDEWLKRLDASVMFRVQRYIDRLRQGNFGDHKSIGDGVWDCQGP